MTARALVQNASRIRASRLAHLTFRSAPLLTRTLTTGTDFKTRTATLSNGLTIATETVPGSPTATVGVWIDAGSRDEVSNNIGAAHFVEHLVFKVKC
ncbi:Mitochondrial-processing peptidase subunit beta [Basidiobolus ranarum]|uniref:mitochondrial processing peptidase n=1 Tax=Basidiobolus ranarum TaxID=34480 RepID=A0ABR2WEY5_9FUNG